MRKNDKGIIVINLIIIVAMVVGAIMVYVYVFKELGKSDGNFSQKEENVVENFHKQEIEKSNLEKNVTASEIPIIETEDMVYKVEKIKNKKIVQVKACKK